MEKRRQNRASEFYTVALILTLTAFLLFRSKEISSGIVKAVDLCLYTVLPSLFGMMVVSNLIASSNLIRYLLLPFSPVTRYIFKLPSHLTPVLLISFIGGYPVGAKLIKSLYHQGEIDQKTAERMLSFCVNSGPAFVISAVSIPIFHNIQVGILVLAAHFCANLIIAAVGGIRTQVPNSDSVKISHTDLPISVKLVTSVNDATRSMCIICSFVIVFSIILSILQLTGVKGLLSSFFYEFLGSQNAEAVISGILEVTQGCNNIAENSPISVYLLAGITSFGGICVHLQIAALLSGSGIKMKYYFLSRLLHLPLSLLFVWFFSFWWKPVLQTFSPQEPVLYATSSVSPFASLFLVLLCIILLFTCRKSAKIKKDKVL